MSIRTFVQWSVSTLRASVQISVRMSMQTTVRISLLSYHAIKAAGPDLVVICHEICNNHNNNTFSLEYAYMASGQAHRSSSPKSLSAKTLYCAPAAYTLVEVEVLLNWTRHNLSNQVPQTRCSTLCSTATPSFLCKGALRQHDRVLARAPKKARNKRLRGPNLTQGAPLEEV